MIFQVVENQLFGYQKCVLLFLVTFLILCNFVENCFIQLTN